MDDFIFLHENLSQNSNCHLSSSIEAVKIFIIDDDFYSAHKLRKLLKQSLALEVDYYRSPELFLKDLADNFGQPFFIITRSLFEGDIDAPDLISRVQKRKKIFASLVVSDDLFLDDYKNLENIYFLSEKTNFRKYIDLLSSAAKKHFNVSINKYNRSDEENFDVIIRSEGQTSSSLSVISEKQLISECSKKEIDDDFFSNFEIPSTGLDLKNILDNIENKFIRNALFKVNGNKKQAAMLLMMNRTTLIEKIRKRDIRLSL